MYQLSHACACNRQLNEPQAATRHCSCNLTKRNNRHAITQSTMSATMSYFLRNKIYPAVTKMREIIEGQCLEDVPDVEEADEAMEESQEIAGPSAETPAAMAADPEESSGLLEAVKDIGEESRRPETVCEEVLRGADPEPVTQAIELLANWPLDMLSAKEKTYGIIPLLEDEGKCLELYRHFWPHPETFLW